MKSYIKAIVIFNKVGEKRVVSLKNGVNIITGESKTGKSALVEIIDYCLCSARCTVPKGKITEFSYLYTLVIEINNNTYIIARYNWENGGRMYFTKVDINFNPNSMELCYFNNKNFTSYKEVQYEIECALGLFVTNMSSDADQKGKKASLRNMVSYLFQHQNLMASKFALFYRFSDYYKRKDVIDQFPVFSGMISQEYYSDLIQLNTLKLQLKQKYKKQKSNEKSTNYIKESLSPLLLDYYALLGRKFDNQMSAQNMLMLASNLPEFDDSEIFGEEKIVTRYNELKDELEQRRNEEREVLLKIKSINKTFNAGNDFSEMLMDLKQQTKIAGVETAEYSCPLCGQGCQELHKKDYEIIEASNWLDNELLLTEKYTSDFSEDTRKLKDAHMKIESEIRELWKQIKIIEQKFFSSKNLVSKREKVNYAKAKIALYAEMSDSGIFETVDEDIKLLKEEIRYLEDKIKKFDVDNKIEKAQSFLSKNMNRLSKTLDFEDEYRPINLNFGLVDESFDIYQKQGNREKIHLYEMGSGANWVSCHIALFLSFLRFFATQDHSPMPLFMFFDQPSQVYFPQGDRSNDEITQKDVVAVNNMYQTIFNEINSIGKDTGNLPQIIIVDHVDGNNLDIKTEFENYIRCNWREGKALI